MWRKSFEIFDLNFLDCLSSCCYILLILWYWCAQNTKNNFDIRACALLPSEILVHNNRHDPGQTPDQNILEKSNFNTGEVQWSMTCWWKYFMKNQFIFFSSHPYWCWASYFVGLRITPCLSGTSSVSFKTFDVFSYMVKGYHVTNVRCPTFDIICNCSCFWPFCWTERIYMVAFGEKIGHIDILHRLDVSYF